MIQLDEEDKTYYTYFLESLEDISNPEFPGKMWIDENGLEFYADYS